MHTKSGALAPPHRNIWILLRGRGPEARLSRPGCCARSAALRPAHSASFSALFLTAALLLYAAPSSARVIPRQTACHRSHQAALRP